MASITDQEKTAADAAEPMASDGVPVRTPPRRLVNPQLTGTLVSDHAALQNDLVQAQELAADFQRQLAGKSNDHAQLKQILEKTQADLAHLQAGIVELRAERHQLANEAMRATAFQAKLGMVTTERDRLRVDLEVVRAALTASAAEMEASLRQRDRRIAELVVENVVLRRQMEEMTSSSTSSSTGSASGEGPEVVTSE